ncbi:MAG: hypothetical protein KBG47_02920 [Bacteroidia bacterium]|nr:hypothetical protein [Bacteroidia bacterium]
MSKLLLSIFTLPLFVFGQSTYSPTKAELTKIYSQAITDFIKAANKKNKTPFDTLFFAKRKNGQPDDFPDIELPKTLEKTHILLISHQVGEKKQNERKSRIYINLIGWVTKENAEFIFVVFSNGFVHQYDYHINYKYNTKLKQFELAKIQFKGPPFDK